MVWSLKFIFWYCLIFINAVIDACEGHQGINDQLPRGIKSYPIEFSRLPYYKDLSIMHLFDAIHIGKNVIEILWKILDGRCDRDKITKICTDIHESNHALKDFIESNSNGDRINTSALPWLLIEKQSDALKEVIKKKIPTGFAANISTLLSKKGDFGLGLKMHDWHTFVKVIHFLSLQYICKIECSTNCIM